MKGQKICPSCGKISGPRTITCTCGYNYFETTKKIIELKSGERGKKKCPHCELIVAARKLVCDCGYNFGTKILEPTKDHIPDPIMVDVNEDWRNLKTNDVFNVLGGGDYYMVDNCKVSFTQPGEYKVIKMQSDGIVAYGSNGTCFIGMEDGVSKLFPSVRKEKHLIERKIND